MQFVSVFSLKKIPNCCVSYNVPLSSMKTTPLYLFGLAFSMSVALAAPPNVVVFLADDAGWGDYSFSGNTQISTPHIDSIAQRGVSMDRFFVSSVCSPTRAEFLTGRYHSRMGVTGTSAAQERIDLGESTLAEAFQAAGYATGAFGKWHNGSQWPYHPLARGFDEYFGHPAGHWGEYFDSLLEDNGRMVRTEGYIVDVCTDRALSFIEKNAEKSFFCYVPFTTPHTPWAAPESDWARFKDMPITLRSRETKREVDDHTRCALAMVENQDMNVGRVLAKLAELGIDDNTIVVYFSDNGPNSYRWNDGMKGRKGSTDEGGLRSVCYIRWPAEISGGQTITQISGAIDLLPTLTALAKVDRVGHKPLDGRDLTALLRGESQEWPDYQHFSTWKGRVTVRTQTHRLDDDGNLFDMVADPGQTTPVNAEQLELAAELQGAVDGWRRAMFGRTKTIPNRGQSIDPRPITVGYREFPTTLIPARDAVARGDVQRSSRAPNSSYFVDWTSEDDAIVWLLDVNTAGRYNVMVEYTCKLPDVGSTVEFSFKGSRLSGTVDKGWDPPLYTNQDTLPRPQGESQMKEFRELELGQIDLAAGVGELVLRATDIPGDSVMDVRRITLTLLP